MSNAVTVFDRIKTDINHMGGDFKMMLPGHIDSDRFVMTVVTAITKNPDLYNNETDKPSLYMACMECAQDGLAPDGREAVLNIFNTNIGTKQNPKWIKKVQYMPMIQGLRKLAQQSGQVKKWTVQIVRQNDEFDYAFGDDEYIKHRPAKTNRGNITHAYSIAHLATGEISREIMDVGELEAVRSCSKNAQNAIWTKNVAEMYRKTVARRHYKSLPKSPEVTQFMDRFDRNWDYGNRDIETNDEYIAPADSVPDTDIPEPGNDPEIIPGEDSANSLHSIIRSCKDMEQLQDCLRDLNQIKDLETKKAAHKVWMEQKTKLEATA